MLDNSYIVLFCVYFYVYELALVWATYKDAGGIWHKDRFRPLCVTVVNLGLNLLTVNYFGLYGVILSTVISYVVVGMPWMLHNVFSSLFHRNALKYILKCIVGILGTVASCFFSSRLCELIPFEGIVGLFVKAIIIVFVSNIIFLLLYHRTKEFKGIVILIKKVLRKNNTTT